MEEQKKQIVERLKKANNVLVTVSNNPSVDQLSACIGMALALNKLDKHATAVFSGEIPSTLEFLQPEETIEKNTDSLRDFIISLDKSKADKLRYKVEDTVVRIFITPYRTSISDQDLEFSQGDFNVDVVIALGVREQGDLDQAITSHGRILHDAAVVTINNSTGGQLGTINFLDTSSSSLSEITTALVGELGKDILDTQISTALLTGIVAETDRFSNEKTSADTMKASAMLMAAGANQQLVATKLQEALAVPEASDKPANIPKDTRDDTPSSGNDGTLEIDHEHTEETPPEPPKPEAPQPSTSQDEPEQPQALSEDGMQLPPKPDPENLPKIKSERVILPLPDEPKAPAPEQSQPQPELPQNYINSRTPLMAPGEGEHTAPFTSAGIDSDEPPSNSPQPPVPPMETPPPPMQAPEPPVPASPEPSAPPALSMDLPAPVQPEQSTEQSQPDYSKETLQDIERDVHSPHMDVTPPPAPPAPAQSRSPDELNLADLQRPAGIDESPAADVSAARDAVAQAMEGGHQPDAIDALEEHPLEIGPKIEELEKITDPYEPVVVAPGQTPASPLVPTAPPSPPSAPMPTAEQSMTMPLPPTVPPPPVPPMQQQGTNPNSPPPVPPPVMPPPPNQ